MTLTFNFPNSDDWRAIMCKDLLDDALYDSGVRMTIVDINNDLIPVAMRTAFEFINKNSEGRYSDRTLMSISRWEKRLAGKTSDERIALFTEDADNTGAGMFLAPKVIIAEKEFCYDEDTETKTGGVLGMLVMLPHSDDESYRAVLSVADGVRRRNIGKALANATQVMNTMPVHFFAGAGNRLAMRLAAAANMQITSVSGRTVQYTR